MILFSNAYLLSQSATARPLTHARIGWQTYTRGRPVSAASASTTAADAAADAPLRPDTYEYWQPTALPATWTVDLGAAYDIDYVGIAGHTIGSSGCAVEAQYSTDNANWRSFNGASSWGASTGETWTVNGQAYIAHSTDGETYLLLDGATGNYASTPHSAAVSITGDIDLRAKVAADDYTPAVYMTIVSKRAGVGNASFGFRIAPGGKLELYWTADGTTFTVVASSVNTGLTDGTKKWVRATLDVDNGAAGFDVRFYTSDDGTTWTQLGATVTTAGTTSIFDSAAAVEVGSVVTGTTQPFDGKIYYAEVRNGIDGPVVAKFDPANDLSTMSAPGDDSPLMFLNTSVFARYWRLWLTGTTMPQVAVVHVGEALAMERAIYGGVTPPNLSRSTVLKNALSRGGRFLGQNYRRNGVTGDPSFRNLTPTFVRDEFDAFIKSARRFPYFFAWRPETYPTEVTYAWTDKDIAPSNMGTGRLMQVGWSLRGIGFGD